MPDTDPLLIQKPKSVWNRDVSLKFDKLGTSVIDGTLKGLSGNYPGIVGELLSAIGAVGTKDLTPGESAWMLITLASARSVTTIVRQPGVTVSIHNDEIKRVVDMLGEKLDGMGTSVDTSIFNAPKALACVAEFQNLIQKWLIDQGMQEAPVAAVGQRFPGLFAEALYTESIDHRDLYLAIELVDNRFAKAGERERQWRRYREWLKNQTINPIFGTFFGLRDVYIPLRAYYELDEEEKLSTRGAGDELRGENRPRQAVWIHAHIREWLKQGNPQDAVRVVSGGPGSGKSSFAKMLVAELADEEAQVLYIPLHELRLDKNLIESLNGYFRHPRPLTFNPIDPDLKPNGVILVFDGLDELTGQGGIIEKDAEDFIKIMRDEVKTCNSDETARLRVVICGREVIVQSRRTDFRNTGEVLYLLPYCVTESMKEDYQWKHTDLLKEDQRHGWWEKYCTAKGAATCAMPLVLQRPDLTEFTAQPLLNYLAALAFEDPEFEFSEDSNLNSFYRHLTQSVHSEAHKHDAERPDAHRAIIDLEFEQFDEILQEIAVCVRNNGGRTATAAMIESHCKDAGYQGLLKGLEEHAQVASTQLMLAFYFRMRGEDPEGHGAFEFTHKTFAEYFTARRMVRALDNISKKMDMTGQDSFTPEKALAHWDSVCGGAPTDPDLFKLLKNEVALRDKEDVSLWHKKLCRLIEYVVTHGNPVEKMESGRPGTYADEARIARNAEEALLAAHCACAWVTQRVEKIEWPSDKAFAVWYYQLAGEAVPPYIPIASQYLDWLHITYCQGVKGVLLPKISLPQGSLRKATLVRADLSRADLSDADLWGANLSRADLSHADLWGADLSRANLSRADLRSANLCDADLRGANLSHANLSRADLSHADLSHADLSRADLRGANLSHANLSRADLSHADLSHADLSRADLSHANLSRADLRGADLSHADLSRADLRSANLSHADRSRADLSRCSIYATLVTEDQLRQAMNVDVDRLEFREVNGEIRAFDPHFDTDEEE